MLEKHHSEFLASAIQEASTANSGTRGHEYRVPGVSSIERVEEIVNRSSADVARRFTGTIRSHIEGEQASSQSELTERAYGSRAQRVAGKLAETGFPIAIGMVTRRAGETLLQASGGPVAAGVIGVFTGAAVGAFETRHLEHDQELAKTFWQKTHRPVRNARDENDTRRARESIPARLLRGYASFFKGNFLERGFEVENRASVINRILAQNRPGRPVEVDDPRMFEELLSMDWNMLNVLVHHLSVQAVLSGFAESGTTKGMRDYTELLLLASAAEAQRFVDGYRTSNNLRPNEWNAAIQKELENYQQRQWEHAQTEIARRVTDGRRWYIAASAVDRGLKSMLYTSALTSLVDLAHHAPGIIPENLHQSAANAVQKLGQVFSPLRAEASELGTVGNRVATNEVQLASITEKIDALRGAAGTGAENLTDQTFLSQVKSVFGEHAQKYIEEGGVGPGSRGDRLEVIKNVWREVHAHPELRNVVQEYAKNNNWNEFDLWSALVMRAQYAGGGNAGVMTELIKEMQRGDVSRLGDLKQGLKAAKETKQVWSGLIQWAVENGSLTENSDSAKNLADLVQQQKVLMNVLQSDRSAQQALLDGLQKSPVFANATRVMQELHTELGLGSIFNNAEFRARVIESTAYNLAWVSAALAEAFLHNPVHYYGRAPRQRQAQAVPPPPPGTGAGAPLSGLPSSFPQPPQPPSADEQQAQRDAEAAAKAASEEKVRKWKEAQEAQRAKQAKKEADPSSPHQEVSGETDEERYWREKNEKEDAERKKRDEDVRNARAERQKKRAEAQAKAEQEAKQSQAQAEEARKAEAERQKKQAETTQRLFNEARRKAEEEAQNPENRDANEQFTNQAEAQQQTPKAKESPTKKPSNGARQYFVPDENYTAQRVTSSDDLFTVLGISGFPPGMEDKGKREKFLRQVRVRASKHFHPDISKSQMDETAVKEVNNALDYFEVHPNAWQRPELYRSYKEGHPKETIIDAINMRTAFRPPQQPSTRSYSGSYANV